MLTSPPHTGDILWTPRAEQIAASRLAAYLRWLETEKGLRFVDYSALWRWSVDDLENFWQSIWDFFELRHDGSRQPVLASRRMPGRGRTWPSRASTVPRSTVRSTPSRTRRSLNDFFRPRMTIGLLSPI